MASPWMLQQLIFLPPEISFIALIVLFAAGIAEARQGHIGRVAIFGNAMLLWQFFFVQFQALPGFMQLYLNIGTAIGLIALASYIVGRSLPSVFYGIAFVLYGSISVILVILGFFSGWV